MARKSLARELKELLQKEESKQSLPIGGIIEKRSRCCNAPLRLTEGVIVEQCTACGRVNPSEPVFGTPRPTTTDLLRRHRF
jgi:hypothetical protein